MTSKTLIIAEAGANHNREFSIATALIDAAVNAGSDIVKFQTYSSETLYSKNTPDFAGYENINDLIKSIELPRSWQKDLKMYCDDSNIEFMSTPFDLLAIDQLYELGVKRLKIAGFESTDPRIVKHAASTKLPLIITAGIGVSLEKVKKIYSWVKEENADPDITFLHGNNAYPTPYKDINLGQMEKIRSLNLPVKVGLSDHTRGVIIPPVAVSLGAQTIEKHFTLSRNMPGPDHPFAIEPNELKEMVGNIRIVEQSLGVKTEEYTSSESGGFTKARRSVIASREIKKGDIITLDNVTTKRPFLEGSVSAEYYFDIIGSVASKDIGEDEIIFERDL